mgnify:CR=1 FL=1
MEHTLFPILAIIIILIGIIIILWRAKTTNLVKISVLETSLSHNTESSHQLSLKLAIAEEKLAAQQNKESAYQQLQQQLIDCKTENTELQTRWLEQQKNNQEKIKLLQDAENQLKTQFENLAHKIFEDRSQQFSNQNKTSMEHIVSPIKDQLSEFKKRVETVYDNETKDRISLREEISSLRKDTEKMNQEALNLTRALKGDNKIQGNWGEMILEKVLEQSGLRKDIEYETQADPAGRLPSWLANAFVVDQPLNTLKHLAERIGGPSATTPQQLEFIKEH